MNLAVTSPIESTDASNAHAQIGFVISYPFHYFIYKNIYKKLERQSEFVIDMGVFYPIRQPPGLLEDILALLKKEKVFYRIVGFEEYSYKKYLANFFSKYRVLAGVWERGCMTHETTASIKKVNVVYGAGKELNAVRSSQGRYDAALVYGKRSATLHSYFTNPVITGNARFDDWFNNTLDPALIAEIKSHTDPGKKTILYLPTHSDLSSIDIFAKELGKLSNRYNVITKLHYFTSREEPEKMMLLKNKNILLYQDDTDLLPLLKVADVVLSDNSSAIFDAILADKPIVVADFWDELFLDVVHKERRLYRRGMVGATTYSKSIEQTIKRDGKVVTIQKGENLEEKLVLALRDEQHFKQARAELREELFSFNDGKCAERAAEAIIKLLNSKEETERPILYHSMEAYKRTIGVLSYMREKILRHKITLLEQAIRERVVQNKSPSIAVIFLHDATTDKNVLELSLGSVLQQEFPSTAYTVHLITKEANSVQRVIDALIGKYQDTPTVEIISHASTTTLGIIVQNIVAQTGADIVCFAEDSYAYPSGWLAQLWAIYKKDEDVGGVGGYRLFMSDDTSGYDQYYYRELRRKLLINTRLLYPQLLYGVTNSIYGQNPAGALYAMSYRKTHLQSIPEYLNNAVHLGLYLKMTTMRDTPVAFIPISIKSLSTMTRGSFLREQYKEGVFEMLLGTYKEKYFLSGKTLVGSIADAFAAAVQRRSFTFGALVLTGHMSYWVGSKKAQIAKMTSNFFFWLTDIKKTLDLKIERN